MALIHAWILATTLAHAEEPAPAPAPELAVEAPLSAPEVAPADPSGLITRVEALEAEVEALRASRAEALQAAAPHAPGPAPTVTTGAVEVPAGEIWDDAFALGGDLVVRGKVRGGATAVGGDVWVAEGGVIEGDAVSAGGRVRVDPGGIVVGNRLGTATLGGASESGAMNTLAWAYDQLVWLLTLAGTGVLTVALFPQRVSGVAARLESRPIRSFLLGAVGAPMVVGAALLFGITVVGLPISVGLTAFLAFAWLLGFVALCQTVGDRLPTRRAEHGRWLAFVSGCLALTFVSYLPWVGALALTAAGLAGVGAAIGSRLGAR